MAATVDVISGGRLVFGIGAGGSRVPDPAARSLVERELGAYGFEVVPTRDAVEALAEAVAIARRMWTETEPFDVDGRWYRLRGAICEPKPVQRPGPPIMIGAAGRRSLRVVAEHADIWNCPSGSDPAEVRRLGAILDDHCAAIGRDPGEIVRSVQLLVQPRGAGPAARPSQPELPRFNDPVAIRDLIAQLVDAGVRHVVLAPVAPGIDRPAGWLADEVVGPVRDALGLPA
jgi:alkanesulfonate monooxygenase SsuD/methylene tetrahydromethanopterin reductase-like flavin-dependent oxidoreductase (luciferase family)